MLKNILLNIKNTAEDTISSKSSIINKILTKPNNEFQNILDKLNSDDSSGEPNSQIFVEENSNTQNNPTEIQFKAFEQNNLYINKNTIKTVIINNKKVDLTNPSNLEKISNKSIKKIIDSAIKNNLNILSISIEKENLIASKSSEFTDIKNPANKTNTTIKTNDFLYLKSQPEAADINSNFTKNNTISLKKYSNLNNPSHNVSNSGSHNKLNEDLSDTNKTKNPNQDLPGIKTSNNTNTDLSDINTAKRKEKPINNDSSIIKPSDKKENLINNNPIQTHKLVSTSLSNETNQPKINNKTETNPYDFTDEEFIQKGENNNKAKKSSMLSSYLSNNDIKNKNIDNKVVSKKSSDTQNIISEKKIYKNSTDLKTDNSSQVIKNAENKKTYTTTNNASKPKAEISTSIKESRSSFIENNFSDNNENVSLSTNSESTNLLEDSISFKFKDLQNKNNFSKRLTSAIAKTVQNTEVKAESSTQVKIIMQPKSLGRIDIVMTNKGDKLDLSIKVSSKGVENILTENLFTLREKIESNSTLNLNNVSIYTENSKASENNIPHRRVEENYSENNEGNGKNQQQHKENNKEESLNFEELQEEYLNESFK